ncbi:MAG: hypothetical protein QOG62_1299 [Thermoleophilaceae bacterium]|nr:hypothetical protein [Thermoleophilaceae bacterium]
MRGERPFQKQGLVQRVGPFVAVAVLSLLVLPLAPHLNESLVLLAVAEIAVLIVAIFAVPWDRLPRWTDAIVPLAYFVVIATLREADGGAGSFGALILLPVIWFALFGTAREVLISCVGACLVFALPVLVIGPPEHPLSDLGRAGVVTLVTTVMGLVVLRLVRERVRLTDELEQSNRHLDQFAAAVSHDLAQPVTVITGFARMFEERYGEELGPDGARYLAIINRNGERLNAMVSGLLALSRAGNGHDQRVDVDMAEAVGAAIEMLGEPIAAAGATVRVSALPTVRAHETQMIEVFQNLIANSLKFAGPDPPEVEITAERIGSPWRFRISDNGQGIPEDRSDAVFEMFERLDPSATDGQGVGLAVVRRIIESHGGAIWVEPREGAGADIRFTLPARKTDGEPASRRALLPPVTHQTPAVSKHDRRAPVRS